MRPSFPFSAIVGQERLKQALLLGVIQPSLGGVLVRGTKGVAKSTAVRALAALLPPLPLVELPLGATEDRVLGALHLEKALRGERALEPGLLAAADSGILYVDEVNLLPDHLVDVLLDAAASGVHRVEREGLSLSHAARFLLVGTMNPEEGELRPQLLDRFGLAVEVSDLADAGARAEAVRRRLAYEADPAAFRAAWQAEEAAESERITRARALLAAVRVPESVLRAVSERCLAEGVEGLRADLTLCQAACARAAYHGRGEVEPADVDAVAEFALAHRRTRPPQPPPERSRESGVRSQESGVRSQRSDGSSGQAPWRAEAAGANGEGGRNAGASQLQVFASAGLYAARARPAVQSLRRSTEAGRWRAAASRPGGPAAGAARSFRAGDALAWAATLRAAALSQPERGQSRRGGLVQLHAADLRGRARRGPAGCLLLFVVDTSGSMAAWRRMRQTKAAVLSLLVQAYRRRDRVALLAFRGAGAELVLPPTRGLHAARTALEELPVGGATPLAHGLAAAARLIRTQGRRQPRQPVWAVVLTDGRANVPASSADAWADALAQARGLAVCAAECLVVDTETGWPRLGKAGELARVLGAECLAVEQVLGRPLADPWRRAV
jgi:magnesium chelatase subunit D